jgi:hypothetical protein
MSKRGETVKSLSSEPNYAKRLQAVSLEKKCPHVDPFYLFFSELEQDEFYPHIPKDQLLNYIQQATQAGERVAKQYARADHVKDMLNQLLKQKIRVRILEKHSSDPSVRAQYIKKPATIVVFRYSIQQIRDFFRRLGEEVKEEDILLLHLYHEWFHHLEETQCGRTDYALPKVIVKQRGPFALKKPIYRLREIAAHSFTQKAMDLSWTPLLLDHLLTFKQKGWSHAQIREHFQRLKTAVDLFLESETVHEVSPEKADPNG